ncbi:MAG: sulfotransferase [Pseudomonadota bacterium]
MTAPIFLYGFARSGTTLLTMMLDSHPALSVPLSVTGLWYRTIAQSDAGDVNSLVDRMLAHERIELWKSALDRDQIISEVRPGHPEDIIPAFHAAKAAVDGKPRWANMDIASMDHVAQLANWFPEARFIHIVRDGRDVALSHQDYAFTEGNYLEIAEQWSASTLSAETAAAEHAHNRHLTITFEALVNAPEETLTRICKHINLDFDAAMLRYTDRVDDKIPGKRRGLWPDIGNAPQSSKTQRWRTHMRKPARFVVEKHAAHALTHFGYEVSAASKSSVSGQAFEAYQNLTRGHRIKRWRRRLGLGEKRVRGSETG